VVVLTMVSNVAVSRMLDGYKLLVDACLKQCNAQLQAFNKRISFASGRMELLQGL